MKQALVWLHLTVLEVGCISDKSGVTWYHLFMCHSLRTVYCNVPTVPHIRAHVSHYAATGGQCWTFTCRYCGWRISVTLCGHVLRMCLHYPCILIESPAYWEYIYIYIYIYCNIYNLLYNNLIKDKMARAYSKRGRAEKRMQKKTYLWKQLTFNIKIRVEDFIEWNSLNLRSIF